MRSRLVGALDFLLKILFPLLLLLGLSALLIPSIYESLANSLLINSGTLSTIQGLDSQIGGLLELPGQLLSGIGSLFGGLEKSAVPDSIIEQALYPGLILMISGLIRLFVIVTTIAGTTIVVYLSYTTSSFAKVIRLEKRVRELENLMQKKDEAKPRPTELSQQT